MDKTRASVESILDKKNSINSQDSIDEGPNNTKKVNILSDISRKDFFDFMRTAYQVYESVEGNIDMPSRPKVDWDELEKNPVIKMLMDNMPNCADDLVLRRGSEGGTATDSIEGPSNRFLIPDTENKDQSNLSKGKKVEPRRNSLSIINRKTFTNKRDPKTDPEEGYIDSVLKSKLSDILNEGILDSVLPYMVGNVKPIKPVNSCHQPIIKKNTSSSSGNESKKSTTFSGIANDQECKEKPSVSSRIGRRKSSTGGEKFLTKGDGEVEIHVCDEVKGLKKDFKCPQKLLVSKMGYFADVTSGQKLEDMDISVHCDIQIFDWLMRWVKKDSILAADWPQLDPTNVVPILVSASFLQMDPLLHDCLMYCHSHMSDIVKTNTNLACLNDTILTRLGAMYTNSELEAIKDRKDKIQSRLFCKMIMSLGEPVSETIRGHYASLATLYKCCKCNKLLPRQIADRVPCTPSSMSIDCWGNIISSHTRDLNWNLSEYITSLHGELKSWRRVYWRLWGECHFLKCTTCDNYFPVHQMEWCCYHADMPQFFSLEPTRATCLPVGRYPCCGERAYRFQVLNNSTQGCQFREHCSEQKLDHDVAILTIYNEFKDIIMLEPLRLMFPERLTRLVARENGDETGRLAGKEIFWWEGLKLAPQRQPLGLLGKLYSGSTASKLPLNSKQVDTSPITAATRTMSMIQLNSCTNTNSAGVSNSMPNVPNETNTETDVNQENKNITVINTNVTNNGKEKKNTTNPKEASSSDSGEAEESESSTGESSHSEESSPPRSPAHRRGPIRRRPRFLARRRAGMGGRQWAVALSARSNQDQQRQYEERAARQMRVLLARRAAAPQSKPMQPLGGVYVRLEAEWREVNLPPPAVPPQRPVRHLYSAKGMRSKQTK